MFYILNLCSRLGYLWTNH